jgi:hypothetical protein
VRCSLHLPCRWRPSGVWRLVDLQKVEDDSFLEYWACRLVHVDRRFRGALETTRHNIPEGCLHTRRREKLILTCAWL